MIDETDSRKKSDGPSPACHRSLRRFWFTLSTGRGIGVTAAGEEEARHLAEEVREHYFAEAEITGVLPDVDLGTLDPELLSNCGPSIVRGVWSPPLNLSGRRDRPGG